MSSYRCMAEDNQSSPFEERVSDDELVQFIRDEEVVTTKEVAEHFDYHLQTARRRLKALATEGDVRQKDVGKRFVWWLPRG